MNSKCSNCELELFRFREFAILFTVLDYMSNSSDSRCAIEIGLAPLLA